MIIYRTGYFSDYFYFRENYKIIAIELSTQQILHAIKRINFIANLGPASQTLREYCKSFEEYILV